MSRPGKTQRKLFARINEILKDHPEMEDILNWVEISKMPVDSAFMRNYKHRMVWDMVSQYNPLSLEIVEEFGKYLRYDLISKNQNLNDEVLKAKIDMMDFDTVQSHQQLSPAIIRHFWEQINPKLIIKYQSELPEDIILDLMERIIPTFKSINELKSYLRLIFEYQTVSENFIRGFLNNPRNPRMYVDSEAGETETENIEFPVLNEPQTIWSRFKSALKSRKHRNEHANSRVPTDLVDLQLVAMHQKLSEKFMREYLMEDRKLARIVVEMQSLSPEFVIEYKSAMPINKILKYQNLPENFIENEIIPVMEGMKIAQMTELSNVIIKNQNISRATVSKMINMITKAVHESGQPRVAENLKFDCWIQVFLRLKSDGTEKSAGIKTLKWKSKDRTHVRTQINWTRLAKKKLSPVHVEQCLTRYVKNIPLYTFLKNNPITVERAIALHEANKLGAMEWWILLTSDKQRFGSEKLPESFTNAHADRLNWWKYVNPSTIGRFYEDCMHAIHINEEENSESDDSDRENFDDESVSLSEIDFEAVKSGDERPSTIRKIFRYDLRRFLNDFVNGADWSTILRYELLEEWFIRVFSNYASKIEMFWWKIARYQKLSPQFINKNIGNLDINIVLGYQNLNETTIRNYVPFFDDDCWEKVARFQELTPEFIAEFNEYLPTEALASNDTIAATSK